MPPIQYANLTIGRRGPTATTTPQTHSGGGLTPIDDVAVPQVTLNAGDELTDELMSSIRLALRVPTSLNDEQLKAHWLSQGILDCTRPPSPPPPTPPPPSPPPPSPPPVPPPPSPPPPITTTTLASAALASAAAATLATATITSTAIATSSFTTTTLASAFATSTVSAAVTATVSTSAFSGATYGSTP